MRNSSVTGLVLAGGRSTRFGSDKARHAWQGRPLIDHAVSALREVADPVLIGAGCHAHPYEVAGARTIRDRFAQCGPLGGLHAGLSHASSPWVLVVACDMPAVTPPLLRGILSEIRSGLSCVVSRTPAGRLQPLCAAYSVSLLPLVESQLRSGQLAMHALVHAAKSVRYRDVAPELVVNVNSTRDLAKLEQARC